MTGTEMRPDREPLPRDAWYVGCASAELGKEAPLGRRVHDLALVLFRDADGTPVALLDRCPHRGVALSLGSLQDGMIACAYHGWRYGADGGCAHIPSLAAGREMAAGIAARHFPCIESQGNVWVWTGEGAPPSAAPPVVADFAERTWLQGVLDLACEAMLPIENNLDICHAYFTHPRLHPQWFAVERHGFQDRDYDLTTTETGLEVTAGEGPGRLRLAFELPGRVTVDAGPAAPMVVLDHVPIGTGRCRQHWLVSLPIPGAAHGVRWTDEASEILEQDRRVMESAQRNYAAEGDGFERSVEADAPTLLARRIVRVAREGGWPRDRDRLPAHRRVVARS